MLERDCFVFFCKQIIIISLTALVNLCSKLNLLLFRRKMFISCILFTLYTKIEMKKVEKWNSFCRRNLHCEFRQNQADNKIVVIKWKKAIKNHCTTGDFYKSIVPTSWKKKSNHLEQKVTAESVQLQPVLTVFIMPLLSVLSIWPLNSQKKRDISIILTSKPNDATAFIETHLTVLDHV